MSCPDCSNPVIKLLGHRFVFSDCEGLLGNLQRGNTSPLTQQHQGVIPSLEKPQSQINPQQSTVTGNEEKNCSLGFVQVLYCKCQQEGLFPPAARATAGLGSQEQEC